MYCTVSVYSKAILVHVLISYSYIDCTELTGYWYSIYMYSSIINSNSVHSVRLTISVRVRDSAPCN